MQDLKSKIPNFLLDGRLSKIEAYFPRIGLGDRSMIGEIHEDVVGSVVGRQLARDARSESQLFSRRRESSLQTFRNAPTTHSIPPALAGRQWPALGR
jgi:hypothetical protein